MHSEAPANLAVAIAPLADFNCSSVFSASVVSGRINNHLHASEYGCHIELQLPFTSIAAKNATLDGSITNFDTPARFSLWVASVTSSLSQVREYAIIRRKIGMYIYNNIAHGTYGTVSTAHREGPLQLPAKDSYAARKILAQLQSLRVAVDDGNQGKII